MGYSCQTIAVLITEEADMEKQNEGGKKKVLHFIASVSIQNEAIF